MEKAHKPWEMVVDEKTAKIVEQLASMSRIEYALSLLKLQPWPHRVDGAELVDELAREIHRFVIRSEPRPTRSPCGAWLHMPPGLSNFLTTGGPCLRWPIWRVAGSPTSPEKPLRFCPAKQATPTAKPPSRRCFWPTSGKCSRLWMPTRACSKI
jgi:hypothetical protein